MTSSHLPTSYKLLTPVGSYLLRTITARSFYVRTMIPFYQKGLTPFYDLRTYSLIFLNNYFDSCPFLVSGRKGIMELSRSTYVRPINNFKKMVSLLFTNVFSPFSSKIDLFDSTKRMNPFDWTLRLVLFYVRTTINFKMGHS